MIKHIEIIKKLREKCTAVGHLNYGRILNFIRKILNIWIYSAILDGIIPF